MSTRIIVDLVSLGEDSLVLSCCKVGRRVVAMKDPRDTSHLKEDQSGDSQPKEDQCADSQPKEDQGGDSQPKEYQGGSTGSELCCDDLNTHCEIQGLYATPTDFIVRMESQESQPGAFAIPGIEPTTLRRQERIHLRSPPLPSCEEFLINAIVVDEEQPSIVFEASPLTAQKGNWKWVTAIVFLISLLVCAIAIGFFQVSAHGKVRGDSTPSETVESNTSENATAIKNQPSMPSLNISSTPSETPSPITSEIFSRTSSNVPSTAPSSYQVKWSKIGEDIAGEQHGDNLGKSLALSSSGKVMAVGLHKYDFDTELDIGVVRLYELDGGGVWRQNGQDLAGSTAGEQAGWTLDLSSDGSIVAVGSSTGVVKVYEYNRAFSFWFPLGQELAVGGAEYVSVGLSLSLSDDGLTLVTGVDLVDGYGTDVVGRVQIFQFSRNLATWTPIAQTFYEEDSGDRLGSMVCLSGNSEVVAIASIGHDSATGVNVGQVQAYYMQVDSEWTPLGSPLSGVLSGDAFGTSISLSMDGMTLAVTSRSAISIYHFDFGIQDWVIDDVDNPLLEEELSFDNANETLVDLSLDGKMMAVSRASGDSLSGSVRVYALVANESQWVLIGDPIQTGDEAEWYTAPSVVLSDNGVLAIGYPVLASENGDGVGKVRTYKFE